MNVYEQLIKAKEKWQTHNYSTSTYKNQLEFNRENTINAISNLIYSYETNKCFTEAETRFAIKLIQNSNK